ncbi:hypothetical protein [Sphingomonas sp.]|uniref:hypothetical protein n=1 Tax=Sphingomonas sp. TaxID=28214 RepID=UPI0025D15181|nr:hypothetical protein [Sphingomonas sp.]
MTRIIVIDPSLRYIHEGSLPSEGDGDFLGSIYQTLSTPTSPVKWFQTVQFKRRDGEIELMCMDEEGLLKPNLNRFLWDHRQPIVGKVFIVGFNDDGEMEDTNLSIEEVGERITFLS